MIADLLRKGLAWARGFFWVPESDSDRAETAGKGAASKSAASKPAPGEPKAKGASAPGTGTKSAGPRRSAAAKTSANKRGTGTSKGKSSQTGGSAAKTSKAEGTGTPAGGPRTPPKSASSKSTPSKSTPSKSPGPAQAASGSTGPDTPHGDAAQPGDLSEIKGIGPSIKTKLAQIGINSCTDLAGADANQVAKSLNQRTITPERVRSWIAEAKQRS